MNLLIVDDDSHIRRLLRIYLRQEGFELFEAATGEEAMTMFDSHAFDIVLLDLILPFYGGLRLCQKFKAKTNGRSNPHIIVITGDDSPETRESTAQAGADRFVAKPFSREEILEVVREVLKQR